MKCTEQRTNHILLLSVTTKDTRAASVHLRGINPLIQELLQGQHLATAALGGAVGVSVQVKGLAQLQGALMGGP